MAAASEAVEVEEVVDEAGADEEGRKVQAEVTAAALAAWTGAAPPVRPAEMTIVARSINSTSSSTAAAAGADADERALVGVMKLATTLDGMYVEKIVVRKDWRRTRGVGRALLGRAVIEARRHAARLLHLATFDFQGLAYYPRVGFTKDADLPGWTEGIAAAFFSMPTTGPEADAAVAAAATEATTARGFVLEVIDDASASGAASASPETTAGLPAQEPAAAAAAAVAAEAADRFANDEIAQQELEAIGHDDGFFAVTYTAFRRAPDGSGRERVGGATAIGFWGGLVITGVAVAPQARRAGVGRALVERLLAAGRDRGCLLAQADVLSVQDPAFWRRLGFTEFGRVGLANDPVQRIKVVYRYGAD